MELPWFILEFAMRGETGKTETFDLPDVCDGSRSGEALGHGNLYVDIMQRADVAYCVLELNPRFGGGFPFSYEAGVNMPKAIIQWVKGEPVDPAILQPACGWMLRRMIGWWR